MIDLLTTQSLLLITGGFVVGVLSVVFGGGFFFSVPLMQWIFPSTTFGAIIGNLKVGSFFRGISSTVTTRKQITYKESISLGAFAIVGTLIGAMLVSHLSQSWLLPATILAVALAEFAPRISKLISKKTFHIASLLTGLYAGVFGAGIGLLLVALLRLKYTHDDDIAHVKIQARFIEFVLGITAVITHWISGNLIAAIWIPWSIGSLAGGYVGGYALKMMTKLSGKVQKLVLRASYVLAIVTAAIKL
jgi:uncharacterized membrane protein YfcA